MTSTLVGIAEAEGALDIDDRAAKYVREWRGTPAAAVTVRDLLSNDSGREWSRETDYAGLILAEDRTWLNGDGSLAPGAHRDVYAALGFGGQVLMVDPRSGTVVVRLGEPGAGDFDGDDVARVLTEARRARS